MPIRVDPSDDEIRRIAWGDLDNPDPAPSGLSPDLRETLDEYLMELNPPRGNRASRRGGSAGSVAAKSYGSMRGAGRQRKS
jgi:hypothetical protein